MGALFFQSFQFLNDFMLLFSVLIGYFLKSPANRGSLPGPHSRSTNPAYVVFFFNSRELLSESVFAMGPNLKYYSHSVSHSEGDGHRCCRHRLKKCLSLSDFQLFQLFYIGVKMTPGAFTIQTAHKLMFTLNYGKLNHKECQRMISRLWENSCGLYSW